MYKLLIESEIALCAAKLLKQAIVWPINSSCYAVRLG